MKSVTEERPRTSPYEYGTIHPDGSLGVFTSIALILLLWGFCWLKSYASGQPQNINVIFHEIAGLSPNASVYIDGVRVGMVEKIDWIESRKVAVKLRIQKDRVLVPVGSKFSILTNGVVGAKYIEITFPKGTADSFIPISENTAIVGEDPVRPELAVNNLAIAFSKIDMDEVEKCISEDRMRLARATDDMSRLVNRTIPLIDKTIPLEDKAINLANNMTKISRRIHSLIDDPNFSRDLKETVAQANLTVRSIRDVMQELNITLKDKDLRNDIITSLSKLNDATTHVEESILAVKSITGDAELRSDVKGILRETRKTLSDVDRMVTKPGFGNDLRETLSSTRQAIGHIDLAAKQVNQILNKRAPLLHLIGGRPGRIKKNKANDKDPSVGVDEKLPHIERDTADPSKKGNTSSTSTERSTVHNSSDRPGGSTGDTNLSGAIQQTRSSDVQIDEPPANSEHH